ncbi:unnamed protein product [Leptidea sinapis]|uniref:WASH complex subunit 3 n=1 Tax=Leptidea sinapis TaxID=189913 RepID=A0A5E4QY11_9NEOP|nr:unnamed protein product [Leptidea sinapis]
MQDTLAINKEITNLDYAKIAALQQKRTLAFINHFVITTAQFLNNFAKQCENKLMKFERKIEKINATMVLLETRLSSIPEVNQHLGKTQATVIDQEISQNKTNEESVQVDVNTRVDEEIESTIKPEYERFMKMLQVGVPLDAVKLKMSLEGINSVEIEKVLGK